MSTEGQRVFQAEETQLQRPSHCVQGARLGHLEAGSGEDAWWAEEAGCLRGKAEGGVPILEDREVGGAWLEGGSRPGGIPAPGGLMGVHQGLEQESPKYQDESTWGCGLPH